ncbi:MAG: hypothetical protein AAFU71_10575 [Cyanobacteria bacterium J06632_22]
MQRSYDTLTSSYPMVDCLMSTQTLNETQPTLNDQPCNTWFTVLTTAGVILAILAGSGVFASFALHTMTDGFVKMIQTTTTEYQSDRALM